ncbi:MAG: RhuM family protein [Fibrobacter sp.]|nr:RhuM family protein [Fibrobacter sp.]
MKNEIVLYESNDLSSRIEVRIEDDTVWLNRQQISELFNRDVKTIGKHINNVFSEGELLEKATVANFATVQFEGGRKVERQIEYYNLDVIISVGYRVKSKQGTQFRIWANKVLKDYLLKGYALNQRMNRIEHNVDSLFQKVNEIDLQINSQLLPKEGIFYDGQVFDAYVFLNALIKSVKKSIVLIDNYIDESVLVLFSARKKGTPFTIFTKNISQKLELDIKKHNEQYPPVVIKQFDKAHDRFLIIDEKTVYHFGASLKDLGKKWFAFSKMDISALDMLKEAGELV